VVDKTLYQPKFGINEESVSSMNEHEEQEMPPGMGSRVTVSIIVFFGLLIFCDNLCCIFRFVIQPFQADRRYPGRFTCSDSDTRSDVGFLGH